MQCSLPIGLLGGRFQIISKTKTTINQVCRILMLIRRFLWSGTYNVFLDLALHDDIAWFITGVMLLDMIGGTFLVTVLFLLALLTFVKT